MRTIYYYMLLAALSLTACSTQKGAVKTNLATSQQKSDLSYQQRVTSNHQTAKYLTARLSVEIGEGSKSISCNGHLRMKRDDVIQLSLTLPLIGTEVGRLEFTPTDVLIIDRFHKQYTRASYDRVDFLAKAGLDFYALQSLFWDELFIPGERDLSTNQLQRFRKTESGAHTLLKLADAPRLEYDFLTLTDQAVIDRVTVRGKQNSDKGEFAMIYSKFGKVGGKPFPSEMKMQVTGVGRDISLRLSLSRIANSSDWETRTTPSEKYQQRTPEQILGSLMNVSL